ncbi:SAM-dependent methyltransferase [Corallococcus sp. H22C18031201]|uniref:class I SAM-dependent methyltransferase n=1 Tax=Citreicoccus inhibens TaxID=2849499 RepID=UPI000E70BD25|nr:class I SAM-dependent methyltransferase [Citreicoccus inhibens]MBU8898027.1 methyltransferase domain-containing protein [Citreicoccus inhibens]RJS15776.1 SAM-dependent methyltransferase [Corallococcus sp. H22C18031201]
MFHRNGPTLRELAEQALTSVERGYDLLAPKFDHTPFRTPDALLKATFDLVGPPGSVDRALDVCCGTGAAMRALRPLCRERVVGVDLSQGMLDEAQRRLADAPGDAALEFQRADALTLTFDAEFDLVTSFGAFGHIQEEDEPRLVQGIARALRPGGRFVFVTGHPPSRLRLGYWLAQGFNAAMRVRNALWKPPFVMYYLTFLVPRARALLETEGLTVEVHDGVLPAPFTPLSVVIATKR